MDNIDQDGELLLYNKMSFYISFSAFNDLTLLERIKKYTHLTYLALEIS